MIVKLDFVPGQWCSYIAEIETVALYKNSEVGVHFACNVCHNNCTEAMPKYIVRERLMTVQSHYECQ